MTLGFTPPMMELFIRGKKTITRRVVAIPKTKAPLAWGDVVDGESTGRAVRFGRYWARCRYANNGSVVYLKEQTEITRLREGIRVRYPSDGTIRDFPFEDLSPDVTKCYANMQVGQMRIRWPRFQPVYLRRVLARIVNVSNDWLTNLTDADAAPEGFADRDDFIRYWDGMNAKKGFPFASNPRVWIVQLALEQVEQRGKERGTLAGD